MLFPVVGQDEGDAPTGSEQLAAVLQQRFQGQRVGVACRVPLQVRAFQRIDKIRGIGNNQVIFVRSGMCEIGQGGMYDIYSSGEGGGFCILLCLPASIGINVDSVDIRLAALCQHQGDQSGSGSDVQYAVTRFRAGPCAEQNAVGSYFHRAFIMTDGKLFELKKGI